MLMMTSKQTQHGNTFKTRAVPKKYTAVFSFPSADRKINAGIKSPLEVVLKNRVLHVGIEEYKKKSTLRSTRRP